MKCSDFIAGKYFVEIRAWVDPTVQRKWRLVKKLLIVLTEISSISFYWYNKYVRESSEELLEQKSVINICF